MGPIDLLIIFVAMGVVGFLTYQRMAKALFSLAIVWVATMLSALLYKEAAYRIKAVAGPNTSATEGLMFIGLFILFFVIGYVAIHASFPVTRLPKLGFLDFVMGFLLGTIVAAVIMALFSNAVGVMVREQWTNYTSWANIRRDFMTSPLRPFSQQLLSLYRWLFAPFFRTLPPVLIPQ
ncbi:MAG TPA: CvpA family protein [Anaerolineae bacterium]|nr:CvpA family protein [Anaerolineae bacterium]HQI82984.1 CvpA family protein [Anaerolineae bacterium]